MGTLVIDTLGLVREAERLGATREVAESAARVIRDMVVEAYDSGMSVEDIRAEFARMSKQLRQEDRGRNRA